MPASPDTLPATFATAGKPVPAVVKCCAIIRLLDANLTAGMTLAMVCDALSLTKSHCLQILRTLQHEGWVRHDTERRRYYLAAGLLADIAALSQSTDRDMARERIAQLAADLRLSCVLTRINEDGSFTAVAIAHAAPELQFIAAVGHRYPPDVPAQLRARLLALEPEQARQALLALSITAYTRATLTKPASILAYVAQARELGYAVGHMEYQDGVSSVAAPIVDGQGQPRWILQCAGPTSTITPRESAVGAALLKTIEQLQRLLMQ